MNNKTRNIIDRFPDFYTHDEGSLFARFVALFGRVLEDVETDLLDVMSSHWVDKSSNEGSQGLDSSQKGDLDKIFALYLESLGGTSQLKQTDRPSGQGEDARAEDALYRGRIKGLIKVLMRGASTLEGIKAIVAANLGIPEGHKDLEKIRIVEFSPDATTGRDFQLKLFETFKIDNPNRVPVKPRLRFTLRSDLPVPLADLCLVKTTTPREKMTYVGKLDRGHVLEFFSDGSALLNGVAVKVDGEMPLATPGSTDWRVEAALWVDGERRSIGRFEELSEADHRSSTFDTPLPPHIERSVWMFGTPALDVNLSLTQLRPGYFTVCIPWDIPGFTEKFPEADHPRAQIGYIVNKVKAAGVRAAVAYEKTFPEDQELADSLNVARPLSFLKVQEPRPLSFLEDQELGEEKFDVSGVHSPYPGGMDQQLEDRFIASGVFDFTTFDSLNTFAT